MQQSLYEKLCEQYPNREVRLVMDKFVQTYLQFGYKIVHTDVEKSEVSTAYDIKYCFMLAPLVKV